jgi:FKBP-type peptidyl-prolyl cis-trans isomerase SlyD
VEVTVPPDKGYGAHDPKLVSQLPISRLPPGTRPMKGQRFTVQVGSQARQVTVTRVRLSDVEIDANHPMVDKNLHFVVRVRQVREATSVELSHRHAHSPKPQA